MAHDSESERTLDQSNQKRKQSSEENGGDSERKPLEKQSPVGFWDPQLKNVRKNVFKDWAFTTLFLMVAILSILSLYWASLFHVEKNMSALVVWVVDFDSRVAPYTDTTAIVGPAIVAAAEALIAPTLAIGWGSLPASQFNYDPVQVRERVYSEKAWAAVIINANATTLLQNAVNNGNASYDPMGAAQVIYVTARDETSYYNYILPQLTAFEQSITASFGRTWARQTLARASTNPTVLANIQAAPQALSPAIGFSTYDLRPFSPAVVTPAVTVGLIYLIIISFFSFSFYMPHHSKFIKTPGHRPLKFWQFILWRVIATIVAYFFLSFAYSLISLAFQIPMNSPPGSHTEMVSPANAYYKATFFVYWMLNFVGMIALGLACENVAMFLGMPWTALWLIFWVITNVSTSFYNIDLAPAFYRWGYAWPLHNIVEASRTILFNTHSRIGLNFGVLAAWCAVNLALFPFACYFMRWQMAKSQKKEQEKKEKHEDEKKFGISKKD